MEEIFNVKKFKELLNIIYLKVYRWSRWEGIVIAKTLLLNETVRKWETDYCYNGCVYLMLIQFLWAFYNLAVVDV